MIQELSDLTKKLHAARPNDGQEKIAASITAQTNDSYAKMFAEEIARQKIFAANQQHVEEFPGMIVHKQGLYIVEVAPRQLLPDMHKYHLNRFSKAKYRDIVHEHAEGIIIFMSFLMNNKYSRELLARDLEIGFVDLTYSAKALEKRINDYCLAKSA